MPNVEAKSITSLRSGKTIDNHVEFLSIRKKVTQLQLRSHYLVNIMKMKLRLSLIYLKLLTIKTFPPKKGTYYNDVLEMFK